MKKPKKKPQLDLFGNSPDDLPLFSGTAMPGKESHFIPQEHTHTPGLFDTFCPICKGTGTVKVKRNKPAIKCTCQL